MRDLTKDDCPMLYLFHTFGKKGASDDDADKMISFYFFG